jgi:release factor glutamine methyltransferase
MQVTVRHALADAARRLEALGIEDAGLEAEFLLRYVLRLDRAAFLQKLQEPLGGEADSRYHEVLARRLNREPAAYITGRREFFGLELEVTPAVLIPRPETELLVEAAVALARDRLGGGTNVMIADVGTGSGAVAVAIARTLPEARVYATDISAAALSVAQRNAARHGVGNRVRFFGGDLLEPLPEAVDVLVANLPYVTTADWRDLAPEVRDFEPRQALAGGEDGLDIIRRLLVQAPSHLRPGGAVALEIGAGQAEAVQALARRVFPTSRSELRRDLAGRDRVFLIDTAKNARS